MPSVWSGTVAAASIRKLPEQQTGFFLLSAVSNYFPFLKLHIIIREGTGWRRDGRSLDGGLSVGRWTLWMEKTAAQMQQRLTE